jgi:hypothetical protein
MFYSPGKLPQVQDPEANALADYLENELQQIASALISNIIAVDMSPTHQAPLRPRTGLIVYADGVDFNPGSGEGLYVYGSDAAWHFLEVMPYVAPTIHVARVLLSGPLTISGSTFTKIAFDTVSFDTGSFWDSANHRFKPTVSGYYRVSWNVDGSSSTTLTRILSVLFKNATQIFNGSDQNTSGAVGAESVGSDLVFMNGTTDTLEVQTFIAAATAKVGSTGVSSATTFSLTWIRP